MSCSKFVRYAPKMKPSLGDAHMLGGLCGSPTGLADDAEAPEFQANSTGTSAVGQRLFERYGYFRDSYKSMAAEVKARRTERIVTEKKTSYGSATTIQYLAFESARKANWLALAAVDAFFAWTEHIFIHVAILKGNITTGEEVAQLASAEWSLKFKHALDISDLTTKAHFDKLLVIRRQLRNFMARGAFGKEGEAFSFHSSAGAVPVAFDNTARKQAFSLMPELGFDDGQAVEIIEQFIDHMWSGPEAPAKIYIQDWDCQLF